MTGVGRFLGLMLVWMASPRPALVGTTVDLGLSRGATDVLSMVGGMADRLWEENKIVVLGQNAMLNW